LLPRVRRVTLSPTHAAKFGLFQKDTPKDY
jgi:hypothetical protein